MSHYIDKIIDSNVFEFASACYDCNTVSEMVDAFAGQPDSLDCSAHNIMPDQWREAITAALLDLADDDYEHEVAESHDGWSIHRIGDEDPDTTFGLMVDGPWIGGVQL